jgi:hypothetical protein
VFLLLEDDSVTDVRNALWLGGSGGSNTFAAAFA